MIPARVEVLASMPSRAASQKSPMPPRLTQETLRKATVYVGETNYYERQQLRDLFIAQGLRQVVCHANLDSLRKLIAEILTPSVIENAKVTGDVGGAFIPTRLSIDWVKRAREAIGNG